MGARARISVAYHRQSPWRFIVLLSIGQDALSRISCLVMAKEQSRVQPLWALNL